MSTRIMLKNVRLSYAHVWEPQAPINGGDPKYSASLIISKADTATLKMIEEKITELLKTEGPAKFGGKVPPLGSLKLPLRDGDTERDDEAYRDSMFMNASSKTRPGIVDQNVEPIIDRDEVYSGVYANVSVELYIFNVNGNRGVACGLGNIQKLRDGEALGGGAIKAENEFAVVDDGASDFLA